MNLAKEDLPKLSESVLRREILIPIFQHMDFQEVRDNHGGILEQGKDIVMWKSDEFRQRTGFAVIVKAGKITGKVSGGSGAGTVCMQILQAFGSKFHDRVSGFPQDVQECIVVASDEISTEARHSIESLLKMSNLSRHVTFWEGETLWKYIQKHLLNQDPLAEELKALRTQMELDQWVPTHTQAAMVSEDLVHRYSVTHPIFSHSGITLPIAILWQTTEPCGPDTILERELIKRRQFWSVPEDIRQAFISNDREEGRHSYDGEIYSMVELDFTKDPTRPKLKATLGSWYGHMYTQASLRWELAEAILSGSRLRDKWLPRRAAVEEKDPKTSLLCAHYRCAALGTSTLLVVRQRDGSLTGLVTKRNFNVNNYPGAFDICPGGMFECTSLDGIEGAWYVSKSVIREFKEEVLSDHSKIFYKDNPDQEVQDMHPSSALFDKFLKLGKIKHFITGICVDLMTLAPAISTIMIIDSQDYDELKPKPTQREFQKDYEMLPLADDPVDAFLTKEGSDTRVTPTGAVTLLLGYNWLKANPNLGA